MRSTDCNIKRVNDVLTLSLPNEMVNDVLTPSIYQIKVRIGNLEFWVPVAMADSNDVPAIFGRADALDRFDANFSKGERVKLQWEG